MANQIKKTKDIIRENGAMLKNIKKQGAITEEQQKNLLEAMKQNANMTEKEAQEYVENFVSQKKEKTQNVIKQTRDGRKQTEGFQETIKTRKEDISLIKKVAEKMDVSFEEAYNMLHGGDELLKKVSNKKESKTEKTESPRKALEKERKAAAIAELERLGMKTDKRVEAINAIQFLDDKILIRNTPWAYENMTGGQGVFKEKTNRHYCNFEERKAEAKKQGIVLPKKEDFENTFKALDLEKDNTGKHILAIILGEGNNGYCDSGGILISDGTYGCLGSVSEYVKGNVRYFRFDKDGGRLNWSYKNIRFVWRPLIKNS